MFFQKRQSLKSVHVLSTLAVHMAKYGPLGTNQNAPFHHGPVEPCNKNPY